MNEILIYRIANLVWAAIAGFVIARLIACRNENERLGKLKDELF